MSRYGATTIVDLIDQRGSEGKLGALFKQLASRASTLPLKYVAFDFRRSVPRCGMTSW